MGWQKLRARPWRNSGVTAIAFALGAAVAVAQAASGPPGDLIGTWEVVHVAVNLADQPHWKHRPEDPSLIGRELVIGADQIRFADFKEAHCEPATWKQNRGPGRI